jgi:hypothetical protein
MLIYNVVPVAISSYDICLDCNNMILVKIFAECDFCLERGYNAVTYLLFQLNSAM